MEIVHQTLFLHLPWIVYAAVGLAALQFVRGDALVSFENRPKVQRRTHAETSDIREPSLRRCSCVHSTIPCAACNSSEEVIPCG